MTLAHAAFPAGSTRPFMARVLGDDGSTPLLQADISTIRYTISAVSPGQDTEAVTGHDDAELTVSDVVFDELQTGSPWTLDTTGYNFRFSPDIDTNDAFSAWGAAYLLEVEIARVSGDPIKLPWIVRTYDIV